MFVEVQLRVDAVSYRLTLDHLRVLKKLKSESRIGRMVNNKLTLSVVENIATFRPNSTGLDQIVFDSELFKCNLKTTKSMLKFT